MAVTVPRRLRDMAGLLDDDEADDVAEFRDLLLETLSRDRDVRTVIRRICAEETRSAAARTRMGGRRG